MLEPPVPEPSDDEVHGPTASDASLRAALANERLHAAHLQELTDQQMHLLRRTPVRLALAVDRRARTATERLRKGAGSARQRAAQARLAAGALTVRRERLARQAALDTLRADLPTPAPDTRTVSLVVLFEAGGAVPAVGDGVQLVLVLVDPRSAPPAGVDATIVRAAHKTVAAAARDGVRAATGEIVGLVRSTSEPLDPAWLARLTAAISGDVVAAVPQVLHPARPPGRATRHDLRVRSLGLDLVTTAGTHEPEVRANRAGEAPSLHTAAAEVAAGDSAGLALRHAAFLEAGGLSPIDDIDVALVDLCARLRAGGGRVVAVPTSVLVDHRPVPSVAALTQPISSNSLAWKRVVGHQQTALAQIAAHRAVTDHLLFRVSIAAPTLRDAPRWGDWHLAEGLARSLRRLGHSVHLSTLGEQDDDLGGRSADVHLVLRGRAPVPRREEALRVLWIISHPETVRTDECDEADLVLVASEAFAADLRRRTATPVEVLLQATDIHRFTRHPPAPHLAHAVAVVAASRGVFRPAVRDALAVGLRPAIYGPDWKDFVDPELIIAEFVPNDELPAVYSSVGVLLNDHWDLMRSWGFVSNRLFDALACETPVVSDDMPEIAGLFGDAVETYRDPEELRVAVDAALEDPTAARLRAQRGRDLVVAHHTLDHRAGELLALMERHGLVSLR